MKKTIQLGILLAAMLTIGATAHAAAPQWKVDPAHSGIYFSVDHIFSEVRGFFEDFDGDIRFDPDNLADSRFDFAVSVASVDTNNTKRDGHLQSDEFFDAGKYPKMRFKSTSISHTGGQNYVVNGTMTIKNVRKDLALPFVFFGVKPNPFNPKQNVAGFELHWSMDRVAYQVGTGKYVKMGVVGQQVGVVISIEAVKNK